MQLVSTETKERTVNIPVPSFWKQTQYGYSDCIAIINDNTAFNIFKSSEGVFIKQTSPLRMKDEIVKAVENWQNISEEEFMSIYSAALKSISLEPVLK